jgi:lipoic acid synthetase
MVGLGEEPREVEDLLADLRTAGVEIVTIGQYLQPSRRNLPVASYVPPEQFDAWREYALALGFRKVLSGPLVRSSYMAETAC